MIFMPSTDAENKEWPSATPGTSSSSDLKSDQSFAGGVLFGLISSSSATASPTSLLRPQLWPDPLRPASPLLSGLCKLLLRCLFITTPGNMLGCEPSILTMLSVLDIVGVIWGNVEVGDRVIGGIGGAWAFGPPGGVNTMD